MNLPSKRPVTPAVLKKRRKESRSGTKEETERGKERRRSGDDDDWGETELAEASYEVREAAKKVPPLMARTLRGREGGGVSKTLMAWPLVEKLFCGFPK